jgi:hypothetical protein
MMCFDNESRILTKMKMEIVERIGVQYDHREFAGPAERRETADKIAKSFRANGRRVKVEQLRGRNLRRFLHARVRTLPKRPERLVVLNKTNVCHFASLIRIPASISYSLAGGRTTQY